MPDLYRDLATFLMNSVYNSLPSLNLFFTINEYRLKFNLETILENLPKTVKIKQTRKPRAKIAIFTSCLEKEIL